MATEIKYPVFQNKALDYNKLLESQKKGKLLNKVLKFPLIAMIKYDGHYCIIDINSEGNKIFTTSGGVRYTHDIDLSFLPYPARYIAERIEGEGKLGDRQKVSLEGPIGSKFAKKSNGYIIHNAVCNLKYYDTIKLLTGENNPFKVLPISFTPKWKIVNNIQELEAYMKEVTRDGYEGLMLIQPDYVFKNTTSRHIDFCKYKKRPTVDLLCIDVEDGEGKYTDMIGSLVLKDSSGRVVRVGSGLSDSDRSKKPNYFIGKVVEMEYEQILDTYIQPTFGSDKLGVTIRYDKTREEID